MVTKGEWAYTRNGNLFVPDMEIKADHHTYNYEPLRGYSASVAVLDIEDRCIGWIDIRNLGFENVRTWMMARKMKDF